MSRGRADWSRARDGESRKERQLCFREWLGGQLRQPEREVPEEVWSRLVDGGFTSDLLDGVEKVTPQDIVKQARAILADLRANNRRARLRARRRASRPVPAKETIEEQIDVAKYLKPEEIKRAQILAEEMVRAAEKQVWSWPARWASKDQPALDRFREQVLGGKLATVDQAERMFQSIGAAMFENEFFVEHGIPVLDHESELTRAFDWDAPDMRHGLTPRSEVTFRWGGRTLVAALGERARTLQSSDSPISPRWRGEELCFIMSNTSVAAWLTDIASSFAMLCPWDRADAAVFALTGDPPPVMPMDVGIPNYTLGGHHALLRVELTIHPWVSAGAVLKFYKALQRVVVGARNRAPTMASLQFFNFVSRQRHQGKSFREAMQAWVRAHPRERKRYPATDPRASDRFANQYRDVERQVLRPFGTPSKKRLLF